MRHETIYTTPKAQRAAALAAVDRMRYAPAALAKGLAERLAPGTARDSALRELVNADARARRDGMRPLRPPPVSLVRVQPRASELALAEDRRHGIVDE